jgi:hypothetical protein
MYVDMAINKYFNMARVYVNNIPGITIENLVKVAKGPLRQRQLKSFGRKNK